MRRNECFLVYSRITEEDGSLLADDLEIRRGKEVPPNIKGLIRYGNSYSISPTTPLIVVNKRTSISNAVNKLRSLELFKVAGLSIPELSDDPPCVGRTIEHTQGQGLWLCWNRQQVQEVRREGANFFIKYIPTAMEWRIHLVGGEIPFIQRKYTQRRNTSAFAGIQGFRDEWHTQRLDPEEAPRELRRQSLIAIRCLGLETGALDGVEDLQGNIYILEINSGPALPTRNVREPYVEYFKSRLGLR